MTDITTNNGTITISKTDQGFSFDFPNGSTLSLTENEMEKLQEIVVQKERNVRIGRMSIKRQRTGSSYKLQFDNDHYQIPIVKLQVALNTICSSFIWYKDD